MNRNRRRETNHNSVQDGGVGMGGAVALPNQYSLKIIGDADGDAERVVVFKDEDNYIEIAPGDADGNDILIVQDGVKHKLRNTTICVSGVESTVKVLRGPTTAEAAAEGT